MANLQDRALELRRVPQMTPLRVFRALRMEFPHAERDVIVRASRIEGSPTGYLPGWAQRIGKGGRIEANGGILRPVVYRGGKS